MTAVSRGIDRIEVTFDDPNLVANAGLLLMATLVGRLGLEKLINSTVRMAGRIGGARPGRKVLTLVHAMVAGATHIDHADVLRSGSTAAVLGHTVMAPSTLGTFLWAFTFGHLRQLDKVVGESLRGAWALGAGPGPGDLVIDVDSTICELCGHTKQGAGFGYTKVRCYHPILATRAGTGEVLHARLRKGPANTQRGAKRFIEELVARLRRTGAIGELAMRFDAGFYNQVLLETLERLGVRYSMGVRITRHLARAIESIDEGDWRRIVDYSLDGVAEVAETTYKGRRLIVRRIRTLHGQQPPGRVAQGHDDVGDHLAYAPSGTQAGTVPLPGGLRGQQFGEPTTVIDDHRHQQCVVGCHHRLAEPVSLARWAAKRSSEVKNPAWASGRRNASGTLVWWMWTSVRSSPTSVKVAVTVIPLCTSVHTSSSGSMIFT